MTKQYTYNNKTYTLKPITLGVMKNLAPVIARLRKLQHEYTKDIDMADVNKAKERINELETAKFQLSAKMGVLYKINELDTKLQSAKIEFDANVLFREKIKLYNECSAMAVLELFSDESLIKPAVESLVEGDIELDFNEPDLLKFLSDVFTDFFLLTGTSKMKSQS